MEREEESDEHCRTTARNSSPIISTIIIHYCSLLFFSHSISIHSWYIPISTNIVFCQEKSGKRCAKHPQELLQLPREMPETGKEKAEKIVSKWRWAKKEVSGRQRACWAKLRETEKHRISVPLKTTKNNNGCAQQFSHCSFHWMNGNKSKGKFFLFSGSRHSSVQKRATSPETPGTASFGVFAFRAALSSTPTPPPFLRPFLPYSTHCWRQFRWERNTRICISIIDKQLILVVTYR